MTATAVRKAPDFPHHREGVESSYPSGGAKIGPAWQWIWDRLDHGPVDYATLAYVIPAYGITDKTLKNLLALGRMHGFLTYNDNVRSWNRRTIRKAR